MKSKITARTILSLSVFAATAFFLTFIQLKVDNPLLLLERLFKGGGWIEIILIASYGSVVAWNMYEPDKSARWRKITWLAFSIFFFLQLIIGITVSEKFLMSGKLHLPVPMMILSGPLYRGEFSVMTILFLSTILLSGPAWCSHFCYFGALDSLAAGRKKSNTPLGKIWRLKIPFLIVIIIVTIILRILQLEIITATIIAISFGIAGIFVMLIFSSRKGKMVHCLIWCPIGTIVSGAKYINPIRLKISDSCTSCMKCTSYCQYDALKKCDIEKGKPAISCTLCGDCITSCHTGALQYKIFGLSPAASRNIYLGITITLHAMTMGLARI